MSTFAVETKDLGKYFVLKQGYRRRQRLQAVHNINLRVYYGETLGIVGESGCGKSTLARMLVGLLAPNAGSIAILGEPLDTTRRAECGKKIQYVFQDALSSLNPRKTIRDSLLAPLLYIHHLPPAECLPRIRQMLAAVNLREDCLSRYPHAFSGGQAQRIGIARALLAMPKTLVLDEPVSALDVSVQAQVLNLLADLKTQFSLTYLLISHDLAVVESISDRVAVMYCGEIVELGEARRLFSHPRHPYTRLLADSIPAIGKQSGSAARQIDIITPAAGCPFAPRCRKAAELCRRQKPVLQTDNNEHHVACHFPD